MRMTFFIDGWIVLLDYYLLPTLKYFIDREEVARIFFVSNFLIAREYLEPGTVQRVNPRCRTRPIYPFDCPHVFKMCT